MLEYMSVEPTTPMERIYVLSISLFIVSMLLEVTISTGIAVHI